MEELARAGQLLAETADVFRTLDGQSLRLYRHQQDAIALAQAHKHFVVTSGTGSGKTLTYFIPIFDAVFRAGADSRATQPDTRWRLNRRLSRTLQRRTLHRQSLIQEDEKTNSKLAP